jgi:glycosyltransferase involved in cell wall biosynthesis
MKVVLLHQSIAMFDAIGNDIAHMYAILCGNNDVFVYCDYLLNKKLRRLDREALIEIIENENNLLIYHHSNYWEEGEEILNRASAKVIIRYHNITPASFFAPYNESYYAFCKKGREQTERIFKEHPEFYWMGASCYNLADAGIYGHQNSGILPPLNNLEQWKDTVPNESVLRFLLESTTLNMLFVGRVVPNKGHKSLIEIVKLYGYRYGHDIAMHIVGKRDEALLKYNQELDEMISRYALSPHIRWVSEIDDSTLLAYYLGCDLYLTCSDHEGFCIPIVEAQSLSLPVVAKCSTAVPETIGKDQTLLGDGTSDYVDEIRKIEKDHTYGDFLTEKGLKNYQGRFTAKKTEEKFVKAVQNHTGIIL